ncbi:MAG: S8 family serine peptidase [Gemmatimonadota bacterium]
MRRHLQVAGLFAVLAITACVDEPSAPAVPTAPPIDLSLSRQAPSGTGRHIVSFQGAAPANFATRVRALGGKVEWVSSGSGLATVSGLTAAAAASLAGSSGVSAVDEDDVFSIDLPSATVLERTKVTGATNSPSDPAGAFFFARQWNMRQIRADAAWAAGRRGSSSVTVAILDTGIDYLHADLAGLVDLGRSIDLLGTFVVNGVPFTERDTVAKYFPTSQPFTDLFFHGTHVAATVSSNALAAAGVTSQAKLMAVKVCAYLNICPISSILSGVLYATANGADVMNLSLGGSIPKHGNRGLIKLINKVFEFARRQGVTIVVSAGNSATDLDHDVGIYESYCDTPATICVSATGPTSEAGINGPWVNIDAFASYSNFGKKAINLAAPGGNGSTFVYAACSGTSLLIPICGLGTFILGVQGTSMASPHVAGAAALLVENLGRRPDAIRRRLEKTADEIDGKHKSPFYGNGRLNVARALGIH